MDPTPSLIWRPLPPASVTPPWSDSNSPCKSGQGARSAPFPLEHPLVKALIREEAPPLHSLTHRFTPMRHEPLGPSDKREGEDEFTGKAPKHDKHVTSASLIPHRSRQKSTYRAWYTRAAKRSAFGRSLRDVKYSSCDATRSTSNAIFSTGL